MSAKTNILKRFIIYMAILTFVMFTVWAFVKSFMNRPLGDYETEVCDIRLKDKLYDKAIKAANEALEKMPDHRGAIMCKALVYISSAKYPEANKELTYLINGILLHSPDPILNIFTLLSLKLATHFTAFPLCLT